MADPLKLGLPTDSWGSQTCMYGVDTPECDKEATRHFFWIKTNAVSSACDDHAAYIHSHDTTKTPFDEHTHGPNCGMPGTLWRFPDEDEEEGYCFVDGTDEPESSVEAIEPLELATISV